MEKQKDDINAAFSFINELALMMQKYGISSFGLEVYLLKISKILGYRSKFLITPGQIITAIWQNDDDNQQICINAVSANNCNMAKLSEIHKIVVNVEKKELNTFEATNCLRQIDQAPDVVNNWAIALGYIICGSGFAGILQASPINILISGILSLVSYGIVTLSKLRPGIQVLTEFIAACCVAIIAGWLSVMVEGLKPILVTLCAVIWFVPGFGLTIAPFEWIHGRIFSGLSWFITSVMVIIKLMAGAFVGLYIINYQVIQTTKSTAVNSDIKAWISAILLMIGFAILFKVRRADIKWVLSGGLLTWATVYITGLYLPDWKFFAGAAVLALFSNIAERKYNILANVIIIPDIMLLVPGATALSAFYTMYQQGFMAGVNSGAKVLILVISMVGGFLFGNILFARQKQ